MNSLFTKTALTVSLSAGLILSSCQDKEAITPGQEISRTESGARLPGNPAVASASTLIKHGDEILNYDEDGRLKEVIYTNALVDYGLDSLYVKYKYGPGWVSASRYEGYFKKKEMVWKVENGKATELETKHYKLGSGGFPYLYTYAAFEYDNKHRLIKVTRTTPEKSVITFSYDGNGNLAKYLTTSGSGKSLAVNDYNEFAYSDYVGGPLDLDKNSVINTHVFGSNALNQIGDPYLPIFGKFGTNLAKIRYTSGPTFRFAHTLDAKGNVKAQKISYWDGQLVKNKAFIYK